MPKTFRLLPCALSWLAQGRGRHWGAACADPDESACFARRFCPAERAGRPFDQILPSRHNHYSNSRSQRDSDSWRHNCVAWPDRRRAKGRPAPAKVSLRQARPSAAGHVRPNTASSRPTPATSHIPPPARLVPPGPPPPAGPQHSIGPASRPAGAAALAAVTAVSSLARRTAGPRRRRSEAGSQARTAPSTERLTRSAPRSNSRAGHAAAAAAAAAGPRLPGATHTTCVHDHPPPAPASSPTPPPSRCQAQIVPSADAESRSTGPRPSAACTAPTWPRSVPAHRPPPAQSSHTCPGQWRRRRRASGGSGCGSRAEGQSRKAVAGLAVLGVDGACVR
jgi:hypothetical protein